MEMSKQELCKYLGETCIWMNLLLLLLSTNFRIVQVNRLHTLYKKKKNLYSNINDNFGF